MPEKRDVLIGLGSNQGQREDNLSNAIAEISRQFDVVKTSKVYESAPMYVEDQPKFLNMALKIQSDLDLLEILKILKSIEIKLGRVTAQRYGPRLIDLDILMAGVEQINLPQLEVPHPKIAEREFVLSPLCDLDPLKQHPTLKCTFAELLAKIKTNDNSITLAESKLNKV